MTQKHLGLLIPEDMMQKLRYAAAYDGRSVNGLIRVLIRDYIVVFEKQHGKIEPNDLK